MSAAKGVDGAIRPLRDLLSRINRVRTAEDRAILVGVDGCGGSGKSTLVGALRRLVRNSSVVGGSQVAIRRRR